MNTQRYTPEFKEEAVSQIARDKNLPHSGAGEEGAGFFAQCGRTQATVSDGPAGGIPAVKPMRLFGLSGSTGTRRVTRVLL